MKFKLNEATQIHKTDKNQNLLSDSDKGLCFLKKENVLFCFVYIEIGCKRRSELGKWRRRRVRWGIGIRYVVMIDWICEIRTWVRKSAK